MTKLINRYEEALKNSSPNQAQDEKVGRKHTVINGINYGSEWGKGDQAYYDLYLKSMEFDNNVDLINYLNEYNSPSSQVSRMRAAGLNPDLQSIENVSAQGQNPSSPSAPSGISNIERTQHIASMSQQFLQLIPQAIDLFTSFKGSMQSLEMNQLQIDSQMQELGAFDAINAFSPDDFDDNGNLKDDSLLKLQDYTDRRLLSLGYDLTKKYNTRSASRRAKQYHLGINNLVRNNHERLRSGVYSKYNVGSHNRSEYLNTIGQYGYSLNDDDFVNILKDFNEIVYKDEKQSASNRYHSNKNKVGLEMMRRGQENIKAGNKISGSIEYILGLLINNNMMPSMSTSFGKKNKTTIGF